MPAITQAADPTGLEPTWEPGPTGTRVSLRGLDAFNDEIVWASGAKGTVVRSADGGSSWTNCNPPGYSAVEFRCVVALGPRTAVVASAGTPAVLLRTGDAGATWRKSYSNDSPSAFFDAMKFWDADRGIAMSDPVDGRILVVTTEDGGNTWNEVQEESLPACREGEAAFAASNGSIATGPEGQVWIGMGGTNSNQSRVYYRSGWKADFTAYNCPLKSSSTEGIFSLARSTQSTDDKLLVAVGGDYRDNMPGEPTDDAQHTSPQPPIALWSKDNGRTWQAAKQPPTRFRSSVIYVAKLRKGTAGFITTGPTGSEYSTDAHTWKPIAGLGYHALSVGDDTVFACGSDGRFAVLKWR
ncbi:MAG: YCF48-related protein [Aureliella sp.]